MGFCLELERLLARNGHTHTHTYTRYTERGREEIQVLGRRATLRPR